MIKNRRSSSISLNQNNHRTSPYTTAILVADKKSTEPSSDDSLAAYVESIKKGKEPALDLSTLEDVLLHPVYKITDRSPSLNTDHNMLNADIATLKANIFAIEKEIKLSFSNRREKAHESIKFHYQDLPSETALKLSNSASFASKSLSGQVNLKSLHGYEELLHRAKISLKQHQEMKGASSKSREIGTQSQLKAMEEKIQLTRQQYYQKSAMAEAGPKYTHHFLTLNGIVLHIEIIKSNKILVLTSKGFLELWMCSNGRQWTMTSCQLLSPRLPKLTCVKVMAPTPLEQHHLATNRVQYLKHHASSSANSFTEKNNLASKERQVDINSTDESLKQFTSETYYFGGSSTSSNVLKEAKSTHLYYVNLINWLSNPREVKTYLLGCINGEVYTYDIGVNENQQVYVKFLHKVQASVTPIKFITYFAPGHRVVLHSHQQDQNGQLTQGLSIFSIPRLDLIQHLPFDKLFSTIPEEVSQSEKETDLWLIPLSSLVADNIRMRLYIGLGCYLFEFMYRDLPLTNESTYTITKTNVAIEESSLEISETSNEDLQNTTEPSFLIELSNSLSLSFRARNLNNSLSNSLPQDTYLQFNMPEPILNEKTDIVSITPYTSPLTFHSYLILSCTDASVQCFEADPMFGSETFYYCSEMQYREHPVQMKTCAVAFSRELQVVCCISTLGNLSLLAMDRKALLNEHQLLTNRLAGSKSGSREIFSGDVQSYKLAIASGNEWSLMDLRELVSWIEVHLSPQTDLEENF